MTQKIRLFYLNVKPENEMRGSALNVKDVLEYIQSQAGKRLDPSVVEKFVVMIKAQ